jgi:hypothetical protein
MTARHQSPLDGGPADNKSAGGAADSTGGSTADNTVDNMVVMDKEEEAPGRARARGKASEREVLPVRTVGASILRPHR